VTPDPDLLDQFHRGEEFVLAQLAALDDAALAEPCALEGWTRLHLASHLARNADALINLLVWAQSGVPHPMYQSVEQRASDIDVGATRPAAVVRADAVAASARLLAVADMLPEAAWSAPIRTARGRAIEADEVPWMRVRESWIHGVDLGAGASFGDIPAAVVARLLAEVADGLVDREDCPPVVLHPVGDGDGGAGGGGRRVGGPGEPVSVTGPAPAVLAWLIGRSDGADLAATTDDGRVPPVPAWL
jgi:maleylpyruvate isomerase